MTQKTARVLNPDGTVSDLPLAPEPGYPMQPQAQPQGYPQGQPQMQQPGQPMSFARNQQQESKRVDILWHPQTNTKNEVQLSDGTWLTGIPNTVMDEPDPAGRVVLALLGEVLTLRAKIEQLEARPVAPPPPPPGQVGRPVPELQANAQQFRQAVQANGGAHVPASETSGTANGTQMHQQTVPQADQGDEQSQ